MKYKIKLKFIKFADYCGMRIVNGKDYTRDVVNLPDSILIIADIYCNYEVSSVINKMILALPGYYQLRTMYCKDYGEDAIPAKNITALFNLLIKITTTYKDMFYIGKNEFDSLLNNLVENNYLTRNQASLYKPKIPVEYDFEEMKQDAKNRRDADLALKLAELCKKAGRTSSFIVWLYDVKNYNNSHAFFANPENIAVSLNGIESADLHYLFEEGTSAQWLLDSIAVCPTFRCLSFDLLFDARCCVNKTFSEFLTNTKYVSELRMRSAADLPNKMTVKHAQILANGLRLNRSVETLDLCDQWDIGDDGLIAIIDALVANAQTRIKKLNLNGCGITERGAMYLLENLNKIPSLCYVNLDDNKACNEAIIFAIKTLLAKRNPPELTAVADSSMGPESLIATVGIFSPNANRAYAVSPVESAKPTGSTFQCFVM